MGKPKGAVMGRRQKRMFRNAVIWGTVAGAVLMLAVMSGAAREGDLPAKAMCLAAGIYLLWFSAANFMPYDDGHYHLSGKYPE